MESRRYLQACQFGLHHEGKFQSVIGTHHKPWAEKVWGISQDGDEGVMCRITASKSISAMSSAGETSRMPYTLTPRSLSASESGNFLAQGIAVSCPVGETALKTARVRLFLKSSMGLLEVARI